MLPEELRLEESAHRTANWQRWGPYLSERQWGTVREDYSEYGECWNYFPHDHARSRAYRWGEDGLLGICDRECRLNFALALWNGKDPILKERLFGLSGPEGNHGEDVKEAYFYLDSTPTHSYMKALYKYPQAEFPYNWLVEENRRRGKLDREFELLDTDLFDENQYFDVFAEYAKSSPDDLLIRITIENRAAAPATIHLLPTLFFRNTWSWDESPEVRKPIIKSFDEGSLVADHKTLGRFHFCFESTSSLRPEQILFTENETNSARVFDHPNGNHFAKDAFHDYVIDAQSSAINPAQTGTKAAPHYKLEIPGRGKSVIRLRLTADSHAGKSPFGQEFDDTFAIRIREADQFYASKCSPDLSAEERQVARQAYAGLLWSKQFYHYDVATWLKGDSAQPVPPVQRRRGRNHDWPHLFNRDVISMPDKWEYPWYAAWDLAFHMIPMAIVDPEFAKSQLILMLREWYQHPNGQVPAYEFAFGDVNPPVHAWACWRVYKMTAPRGKRDHTFLARVFQKLLINFTWWVNRKDVNGQHLFSGGFLGLDNIGVFDRSRPLPTGQHLEQADGTAWMAFYCSTMLAMALELAHFEPAYEDIASKFFEHFIDIAKAMNCLGGSGLWDDVDGFYYDQYHVDGTPHRMKIRSIVGLIPLFAVEVLEDQVLHALPGFRKRMEWFIQYRPELARQISCLETTKTDGQKQIHRLLAIPSRERLERVLRYVLDEAEFLAPNGIRALSRYHAEHPYAFSICGEDHTVTYAPGESTTRMFGGNSNWRGPIWFPVNYLLVEALERYHYFYGDTLQVEYPTGSGNRMNLKQVAVELSHRLASLFLPNADGFRPCHEQSERFAKDPHWKNLVLFYEYFHGDNGRGIGASHQTGWTSLVVRMLGKRP